uniref:H/ACA ribonucleoprotein complex non-core subunit NAF1 n=1 Tax=Vitis vinifera TaxID=29760 RepID=A5AI34_VITVI|nr:hypothetical protein VITISV_031419 [Vitis vinifera]
MAEEGSCKETTFGGPITDGSKPSVNSSEQILDGSDGCAKKLGGESMKFGNLGSLIEEEMGKVSLVGLEKDSVRVGGDGMESGHLVNNSDTLKTDDLVRDGDESESSSESESSTSSSSSSSSSRSGDDDDDPAEEEEEKEEKEEKEEGGEEEKEVMGVEGEVEEGEIRDDYGHHDDDLEEDDDDDEEEEEEEEEEMIAGSDYDGEDDSCGNVKGGAIKSKNEIEALPPVPPLDVTLQPHHQTLPVGVVSSIIGAKVIVEGAEKHKPLTEGSILWITESRSPLGLIDEIFGPVKNPYYVVRYNSDSEVPAGINEGTFISFVPQFANHILNERNLYKKGYDASGENDEEVSDVEFSDDEEEAEHKRTLKMIKRGTNDQKPGNKKNKRKKVKNRDGAWKNGQHSTAADQFFDDKHSKTPDHDQHHTPQVAASSPFGVGQFFAGGGLVPPYPQMAQVAGFIPPPSGIWASGIMPCQQQQNTVFPNSFPRDTLPWPPQNHHPHPFQMPMPNGMLFQQQFDPGHAAFPNAVLSSGQANFFMRPTYPPWPGLGAQSGLNQAAFGMGLQGQHARPIISAGEQGALSSGLPMGQSCDVQPPAVTQGKIQASQQFNQRASFGRGKKPFHRGGGRFAGGRGGRGGGRGRQQSK